MINVYVSNSTPATSFSSQINCQLGPQGLTLFSQLTKKPPLARFQRKFFQRHGRPTCVHSREWQSCSLTSEMKQCINTEVVKWAFLVISSGLFRGATSSFLWNFLLLNIPDCFSFIYQQLWSTVSIIFSPRGFFSLAKFHSALTQCFEQPPTAFMNLHIFSCAN